MKKFYAILLSAVVCAGVCLAVYTTGAGRKVTATTVPVEITMADRVATLSVYNSGTNEVFCLVDCTTNVFATRLAAGTTVPIPAGSVFTFDTKSKDSIGSISLSTTNASSDVYIAGY